MLERYNSLAERRPGRHSHLAGHGVSTAKTAWTSECLAQVQILPMMYFCNTVHFSLFIIIFQFNIYKQTPLLEKTLLNIILRNGRDCIKA